MTSIRTSAVGDKSDRGKKLTNERPIQENLGFGCSGRRGREPGDGTKYVRKQRD